MRVFVRLLEEAADRCLQLSYQSRHEKASRVMRLLAVDLMLAAEQRRHNRVHSAAEQRAELARLSRSAGNGRRQPAVTPESVSTA
jgi:hypothetical protein